jgi:lysophospholipase L1-like esterase
LSLIKGTVGMLFKKGDTLLMTGDSVTDCGRSPVGESAKNSVEGMGDGYPAIVKAYLNAFYPEFELRIVNKGIGGNRTVDILKRMQRDHLDLKPDIVTILIGVNDVWRQFDTHGIVQIDHAAYEKNLTEILEKLKTSARKIFVLTPFLVKKNDGHPMYKMVQEYREIAVKVARKAGTEVIDLQAVFDRCMEKAEPELYSLDTVHPTICGHMVIAGELLKAFMR